MKTFIRILGILFLINGLLSMLYAIIVIGSDLTQMLFFGLFGALLMFIGNRLYYWHPRLLPKSTHGGKIKYQYNNIKIIGEHSKTPDFDFTRLEPGTELKLKYDRNNEEPDQVAVFYKSEKIGLLHTNKNVRKKIIAYLGGKDKVRAVFSANRKANCDVGLYQ